MNEEKLKDYIKTIDPELKQFLKKDEWRKKLRKICSDYGVKDEALIVGTENETLMVIIGVEYVGNFVENLQKTGLPKIQAEPLADAIAKDILFDISEYLSSKDVDIELPDASVGLIDNKEVILKNPIQTSPKPIQPENAPKNTQTPAQINTPKIVIKQTVQPPQMSQPTNKPKDFPVPNPQMSWEERKKKAEEALKNIVPAEPKKYPGGADPYREPIL
ncbi:MAG: hypothetical protein WA051_01570 [Minisyncoccia bacterium]